MDHPYYKKNVPEVLKVSVVREYEAGLLGCGGLVLRQRLHVAGGDAGAQQALL